MSQLEYNSETEKVDQSTDKKPKTNHSVVFVLLYLFKSFDQDKTLMYWRLVHVKDPLTTGAKSLYL